jgi:iron complex transport system ATP-binding protein
MALIEVRSLCFGYTKDSRIFDNIDISIEAGTINVILGLNGCGKTTLIKLLAGLMKSRSGNIIINGKPILSMSDHERSKLIAYVPQIANSRIAFTVEEYLTLSLTNQKSIY